MSHKRRDGVKGAVWKRILFYGLLFFFLGVGQCSFFAVLTPFGVIPNLMLGALCGIAMMDSMESALVTGIAAGFLCDAFGGGGYALSPVFFLFAACLCSSASKKMLSNFLSFGVILCLGALVGGLCTYVNTILIAEGIPFTTLLRSVLIPEWICTVLFSLPLYPLLRFLTSRAEAKSQFRM